MNPYMNEEVMWQRVKDLQREAENRRLMGPRGSSLVGLSAWAGRWADRQGVSSALSPGRKTARGQRMTRRRRPTPPSGRRGPDAGRQTSS